MRIENAIDLVLQSWYLFDLPQVPNIRIRKTGETFPIQIGRPSRIGNEVKL